jgi:hypothetical protein
MCALALFGPASRVAECLLCGEDQTLRGHRELSRLTLRVIRGAATFWSLEHDPEKWEPVFGKDHAQTKC